MVRCVLLCYLVFCLISCCIRYSEVYCIALLRFVSSHVTCHGISRPLRYGKCILVLFCVQCCSVVLSYLVSYRYAVRYAALCCVLVPCAVSCVVLSCALCDMVWCVWSLFHDAVWSCLISHPIPCLVLHLVKYGSVLSHI